MLILAVDTSDRTGSLALVRFGDQAPQTLEAISIEGGTFSAQLIPQLAALLEKHGLTKRDIDGFAVVSGPGSFTGLRVGLAAVKALAEILDKPIAPVSLLEALARENPHARVASVLDAGRGEVYAANFEIESGVVRSLGEEVESLSEFIASASGRHVVTSDQKLAEMLTRANVKATLVPRPQADAIASIGYEQMRLGRVVTPEALDATYIRRSDAEIKKP